MLTLYICECVCDVTGTGSLPEVAVAMTTRSKDVGSESRWIIKKLTHTHTQTEGLQIRPSRTFHSARVTSLSRSFVCSSSIHLFLSGLSCRYADVRSLITCMHTQANTRAAAAAACSRKHFISASFISPPSLQSSFLSLFFSFAFSH